MGWQSCPAKKINESIKEEFSLKHYTIREQSLIQNQREIMKQTNKHTTPLTLRIIFDRYHHYILTGVCLLFIAASFAMTGCDVINSDDDDKTEEEEAIETLRAATEPYKDIDAAIADGFEQVLPCTENPEGPGALGVVYINPDRLDTNIDLEKPEVLFYEPQQNGDLQLVGGEPVVPIEQWEASNNNPPSLFGREFHRNEDHGLYGLHMWVWKENTDGVFGFWNSNVSCEYAG